MTRLLDINVLLALAWEVHPHHDDAHSWVAAQTKSGPLHVATCPLTELGFLRISMQMSGVMADLPSARAALMSLRNQPEFKHHFWPDSIAPSAAFVTSRSPGRIGPKDLTDIYLAELAVEKKGVLATFDTKINHPEIELIHSSATS